MSVLPEHYTPKHQRTFYENKFPKDFNCSWHKAHNGLPEHLRIPDNEFSVTNFPTDIFRTAAAFPDISFLSLHVKNGQHTVSTDCERF